MKKAFTLIELLVVISIVALLIALLLPALGNARYSATNVQCVNNLRQQSIGLFAYALDSGDWYPASPTTSGNSYAPTLMRWNASDPDDADKLDYRDQLLPYYTSMHAVFTCPLAPDAYSDGAVSYGGGTHDLDTSTANYLAISYSQYYGRTTLAEGGGDPAWGSGSVFFKPAESIKKLGDRMKVKTSRPSEVGLEFRVLASDAMWMWWEMLWSHETPGQPSPLVGDYQEFKAPRTTSGVDYNYLLDDGSAHTIGRVVYEDPRVTVATQWVNNWARGWVLPLK